MKTTCLLVWLALPVAMGAQAAASTRTPPAIAVTGAFFALSVADLEASARWYAEKLGLTVVMRAPKQGKAAATVLEGGGLIVELIQHDDALPLSKAAPAAQGGPLLHGMFKAGAVVEDFD